MLHTNDSETADAEPQRLRPSAIVVVAVFRGPHMQLGCQHHRHLNYGVVFSRNSHANATLQVGRGWWMELALSAAVSRVHCGKLASERLLDRKKVVNYFYLVVVIVVARHMLFLFGHESAKFQRSMHPAAVAIWRRSLHIFRGNACLGVTSLKALHFLRQQLCRLTVIFVEGKFIFSLHAQASTPTLHECMAQ